MPAAVPADVPAAILVAALHIMAMLDVAAAAAAGCGLRRLRLNNCHTLSHALMQRCAEVCRVGC